MLTAGSRIGQYEIVALLGAGGMGEVYRARDPRIGREVALKVLPAEVANDRERLARFDQEARAAGMLNHPNLLMIHELGIHEGQPYIVSELLEGTTLRERMSGGPISQRKAIEYASQIADGLATAHERGIVHRDLKPENIFITKEGRAKILDFGLAKLRSAPSEVRVDAATVGKQTDPGTVLGSAGYMSPEQVRGESVDHRSDIFSFGVILYEMLTGERAFKARSSVETMNAILNTDPPEISSVNPQIGAALQRIVDHCLEKHREGRFQSSRDLAFDLAALSDLSISGGKSARPGRRWPAVPLLIAAAAMAIVGIAAFLGGRFNARTTAPRFTRITFHSAFISGATLAPDGQSIVYSSSAGGKGQELYVARLGSPEERSLGIGRARILSMSSAGEMAVLLEPQSLGAWRWSGTLARMPYAGGAPREIATDVENADWSPSADELAIIRVVGGHYRVEFPIGKPLYQVGGWLSEVDVSPDGRRVAVIEHPAIGGDEGSVVLIDADGKARRITSSYNSIQGLAWSPGGREIWFTASKAGLSRELYAVTLFGKERRVVGATGVLTLRDIASDGRVLITQSSERNRAFAVPPGETALREMSWLDWSVVRDLSPDGKLILLDESGEGGGSAYSVYLRRTDGSPAVRLGDGIAAGFSPDGRWALAIQKLSDPPRLVMYPIGAGESRVIRDQPWIEGARWMPDGAHVVATAHEPNRGIRLYLFDVAGATARPISPEGFRLITFASPDGQFVCALGPERARYLIPTGGGPPRILKADPSSALAGWSPDGKSLLWFDPEQNPLRVMKFDVNTGRNVMWKEIAVPPSERVVTLRFSRDLSSYAFTINSNSGDVYVLEGAK